MKIFDIVAVLVLLFSKTGADFDCIGRMHDLSKILDSTFGKLEETKNELDKVRTELEAERNKSISSTIQPTTDIPQIPAVYECTFENITGCGYTIPRTENSAHWLVGHGKRAIKTGPEADHTLGSPDGNYLYIDGLIEAEQPGNIFEFSKTARVEFPPIVPAGMSEFCISFWYSMYGKDVKTLKFHLSEDGTKKSEPVFTKTGEQGEGWKFFQHRLPKTKKNFSFSFEATTTAYGDVDFAHDKLLTLNTECNIAIDDIRVVASPCKGSIPTVTQPTVIG